VQAVVDALRTKGVMSWGKAFDVADADALQDWVECSAVELGGIDILVCNASALAAGNTPETWERSFRVDIMHTVNAVTVAQPYLEKSEAASVVITDRRVKI
jgi:NAD(P)-dependent dehydrogenase (short-subunit alcohol dehydrogenase family)